MKHEKDDLYSFGCSDGAVRMFRIGQQGDEGFQIDLVREYNPSTWGGKHDPSDPCLMHDSSASCEHIAAVTSTALHIYDTETAKLLIQHACLHECETWYTYFSPFDSRRIYTCSDDASFKMLDFRTPLLAAGSG